MKFFMMLVLLFSTGMGVKAAEYELIGDIDEKPLIVFEGEEINLPEIKGRFFLQEVESDKTIPVKFVREVVPLPDFCYNSFVECEGAGYYYVVSTLASDEPHKKQTLDCNLSASVTPLSDPFTTGVALGEQHIVPIRTLCDTAPIYNPIENL